MSGFQRLVLVVMAAVFAGLAFAGLFPARPGTPAAQPATTPSPASDSDDSYNPWGLTKTPAGAEPPPRPLVLNRDDSGQFHLSARANGHDTAFLVDTGADLVSLTPADAETLGLHVSPQDYQPVLRTASGTAMGARVAINRLEVAGRKLTHVDAVVVQGLGVNLLGQSALRQLGRVELRGDTMVLAPH